jgi:hypothetical protein
LNKCSSKATKKGRRKRYEKHLKLVRKIENGVSWGSFSSYFKDKAKAKSLKKRMDNQSKRFN